MFDGIVYFANVGSMLAVHALTDLHYWSSFVSMMTHTVCIYKQRMKGEVQSKIS